MLVAVRYGLSRQSVHEWMGPYHAAGLPGLTDRVPDREGRLQRWLQEEASTKVLR